MVNVLQVAQDHNRTNTVRRATVEIQTDVADEKTVDLNIYLVIMSTMLCKFISCKQPRLFTYSRKLWTALKCCQSETIIDNQPTQVLLTM